MVPLEVMSCKAGIQHSTNYTATNHDKEIMELIRTDARLSSWGTRLGEIVVSGRVGHETGYICFNIDFTCKSVMMDTLISKTVNL